MEGHMRLAEDRYRRRLSAKEAKELGQDQSPILAGRTRHRLTVTDNPLVQPTRMKLGAADQER